MPLVSVVMPVYNGQRFLQEAIDSILSQSFQDFEFIIVNDGSTDESEQIILNYSDSRIKLINNKSNLGIIESLNRGINLASGLYICRMDADDISLKDRIKLQADFMNNNPSIAVVGTNTTIIDSEGKELRKEYYPSTMKDIMRSIFIHNPFAHGSVMIRASVLKECGLYDKRFIHAEDYDLWLRIGSRYQFANLKDIFLLRRIHESNITVLQEKSLILSRIRTIKNAIFNYYHKPFLSYYLLRPAGAYFYRLIKGLVKL